MRIYNLFQQKTNTHSRYKIYSSKRQNTHIPIVGMIQLTYTIIENHPHIEVRPSVGGRILTRLSTSPEALLKLLLLKLQEEKLPQNGNEMIVRVSAESAIMPVSYVGVWCNEDCFPWFRRKRILFKASINNSSPQKKQNRPSTPRTLQT